jgi:hypothetical protein
MQLLITFVLAVVVIILGVMIIHHRDTTSECHPVVSTPVSNLATPTSILYERSYRTVVSLTSFFIDMDKDNGKEDEEKVYAETILGSGFFVHEDGYICTASHNIYRQFYNKDGIMNMETAEKIIVSVIDPDKKGNNKQYTARIVGIDGKGDMAIIKIEMGYPALVLLLTGTVEAGMPVIMIGDPYGMDSVSCSTGVVRDDFWTDPTNSCMLTCIMTDIRTSPGNSGSPIIASDGSIVSIHTDTFGTSIEGTTTFGGGPSSMHIRIFVNYMILRDKDPSVNEKYSNAPKKHIPGIVFVANSPNSINSLRKKIRLHHDQHDQDRELSPEEWNNIKQTIINDEHFKDSDLLETLDANCIVTVRDAMITQLPKNYRWVDTDGFLVINVTGKHTENGMELGDVVTHINEMTVGINHTSRAMGDILWYLKDPTVDITVVRNRWDGSKTVRTTHHLTVPVVDLPTELDVSTQTGDQGYGESIGGLILALAGVVAAIVAGGPFGIAIAIAAYGFAYLKGLKDLGTMHGLDVSFLFWL